MKLRNLRIALSAFCALAATLLIALWVRSYRWCDVVEHRNSGVGWVACSEHGEFLISSVTPSPVATSEWTLSSDPPVGIGRLRHTRKLTT